MICFLLLPIYIRNRWPLRRYIEIILILQVLGKSFLILQVKWLKRSIKNYFYLRSVHCFVIFKITQW